MGKNRQLLKLFVVMFFSTVFIFCSSYFGAKAFGNLTNPNGKFSDGTTIGALDVSGKTEDEALILLKEQYVQWPKNTSIELQYGEKTAPFDLNQFHLDANQTVVSIKAGQKNPAFITIAKAQVEAQIQILFPQLKSGDINLEKLTSTLNKTASLFEAGAHSFNLFDDYLLTDRIKKDVELNVAVINLNEIPVGLQTIIKNNSSIEIPAESTFSLLEFAKKQKITDSIGLNIIATGIYQAILPSNFSIVERNISSSLPEYAELGLEAKVNETINADFVIKNPNKTKYLLELQLDNDSLKVTLKGKQLENTYKITKKEEQKLQPKTIIQYSPLLQSGKTKIETIGADGFIVRVYRDLYQGNSFIKSEFIAEDYYPPTYQVEIHPLVSKQGTEPAANGADRNNSITDSPSPNGNQATSNPDPIPAESTDSDLWGKQNEQPK